MKEKCPINKMQRSSLPKKYEELIPTICKQTLRGYICYLNPETFELECSFPICSSNGQRSKHYNWSSYFIFYPPQKQTIFNWMYSFIEQINMETIEYGLTDTLLRDDPALFFTTIINSTYYKKNWTKYQKARMKDEVRLRISAEIGINGNIVGNIFDRNGVVVEEQNIPIPELCHVCENFRIINWDTNLLCRINRLQEIEQGNTEFQCYDYTPLL